MGGREVTEVKLSDIDLGDRADAEYFSKESLQISERLSHKETVPLGRLGSIAVSAFYPAATHLYETGDTPFIRCVDCINYPVISDLQDDLFERIPKSFVDEHSSIDTVTKDDIIITKVGTPCFASIVEKEEKLALSRTVMGLKDVKGVNPYYLLAFLRSYYGFSQLMRQRELTIQYQLTVDRVKAVKVFIPSSGFQSEIERLAREAQASLKESRTLYTAADNLLLKELGLLSFTPSKDNTAVKTFRETFLQTGRLDAEYFHPEKGSVLEHLDKFQGEALSYYVSAINEVIDPIKGGGTELVSNFDLNDALEIYLDDKEPLSINELGSTKKVIKKGDVVVSRLRSYLKEIAIVDISKECNAVGSTEFIVLRPKEENIKPETLLVYLKSLPVQLILKWCQSGSNHPRFMEEDLLSIKVPHKILALQETLQSYIREAIDKSRKSKRLFDAAKRAVEIAVEEDENAALKFIAAI